MPDDDHTVKTDAGAQSGAKQVHGEHHKKPVDVATLEESVATSETSPDDSAPVAVGEAAG